MACDPWPGNKNTVFFNVVLHDRLNRDKTNVPESWLAQNPPDNYNLSVPVVILSVLFMRFGIYSSSSLNNFRVISKYKDLSLWLPLLFNMVVGSCRILLITASTILYTAFLSSSVERSKT